MLNLARKTVDTIYGLVPRSQPHAHRLSQCKIIAHRGEHDSHVLENTLAAFDKALEAGVYGIEFDIRWTKDLQPVVFHDMDLKRLFNASLKINALSLAELQRSYPMIPSLEAVVERYGKKLHLMAEIKYEPYPDLSYQNKVLEAIFAKLVPNQDYHLMTLDMRILDMVTFVKSKTWLLIAEINTNHLFKQVLERQLGGITGYYVFVDNSILKACQQRGLLCGTGHIDNKNCLYRELNRGIEWIFTNRATYLQAQLRSVNS